MRTVWVTCDGENPADVENMGVVYYYPTKGFTGEYFPFLNQDGYLSPIVAVHFLAPTRKSVLAHFNHIILYIDWHGNRMIFLQTFQCFGFVMRFH